MKKNMKRLLGGVLSASLVLTTALPIYAAEKKMVEVTVDNSGGNFLQVYYYGNGGRVQLPFGETTEVPFGSRLTVRRSDVTYYPEEGTKVGTIVDAVLVNGEELSLSESYNRFYVYEDTEITADIFGVESEVSTKEHTPGMSMYFVDEDGEYQTTYGMYEAGEVSGIPLAIYNEKTGETLEFSDLSGFYYDVENENEDDDGTSDNAELYIDEETGVLMSSGSLEAGEYNIWIEFEYETEDDFASGEAELEFVVGAKVTVELPLASYEDDDGVNLKTAIDRHDFYISDPEGMTYGDIYELYLEKYQEYLEAEEPEEEFSVISGYENIGLGEYDEATGTIVSCMEELVSEELTKSNLHVTKYLIPDGYVIPKIAEADSADIVDRNTLIRGWNGYRYFKSTNMNGLETEEWVVCPNEGCEEEVWVGPNGVLVTDEFIEYENDWYWIDEQGHGTVADGSGYYKDGFYTFEAGKLKDIELYLEVPTTVIEAAMLVDKVEANEKYMSQASKISAADILTEGLMANVQAGDVDASLVGKLDGLYVDAYMEEDLTVTSSDGLSIRGDLVAAGLYLDDVLDGAATVEYTAEWIEDSESAQKSLSLKLYVNGEEKEELVSKIRVVIDLPEDVAALADEIVMDDEDVEDVSVEDGTMIFWTSRLGKFELFEKDETPGTGDGDETTPDEGGDETTPDEGGDETTPDEGGDETTPDEGGDETTPDEGGDETTPDEGGDETTPDEGGDETTPDEGGDETTPDEGGDETTPDEGGDETAPDEGGDATTPDEGGDEITPDEGGDGTTPDEGGDETTPDEGGDETTPDEGGDEATPDEGGDETTPDEGGDETTPDEGGDETTPDEGGDETTPDEGGDETTPDEGGDETTPDEDTSGTGGNNNHNSDSDDDDDDTNSSATAEKSSTANKTAEKGTWVQSANGWTFKHANSTSIANRWAKLAWNNTNKWYHFNESGLMTTGWLLSNGKWYYLHPEADGSQGYMYTGWNQINGQWFYMNPEDGSTQGAVVTGWNMIDGKWYYFSEAKDSTEGMMLSNTTTPDGYVVGADGAWIQ